jgi:hypothetical protein
VQLVHTTVVEATTRAVRGADVCVFVYDARAGVTPADEHFVRWLRRNLQNVPHYDTDADVDTVAGENSGVSGGGGGGGGGGYRHIPVLLVANKAEAFDDVDTQGGLLEVGSVDFCVFCFVCGFCVVFFVCFLRRSTMSTHRAIC